MPVVRRQETPSGKALFITIPKAIWKLLGIQEGDKLDFELKEGDLLLNHITQKKK